MASAVAAASTARPLRVALLWNGAIQAEEVLTEPRAITLGEGRDCLFALPEGLTAADSVTLLKPSNGRYAVQPNALWGGFVCIAGQRSDASALRTPAALGPNDYGVVTVGSLALFFQHVNAATKQRPESDFGDPAVLACLGLSIFLHVGALLFLFLVAAKELAPVGAFELDAELVKKYLVVPPPIDEPLMKRRKAATETVDPGLRDRDEMGGKKHEKAEGRVGKKDAPREDTQIQGEQKDAIATKVRAMGLLGVLAGGGPNSALHSALDTPSLDKMLGGLGSMQTVAGRGSGGFGLRGSGSGGGGTGKGSLFGAGELGTGVGSGNGSGHGRGAGGIGLPGAKAKEAQLSLDNNGVKVHGFLSKEQIDRVVRANQAAIKYCFEVEMQRQPKLEGAVHMNWRIDLQGQVSVVKVAKSTLDNSRVEGCMARQIKRWIFPKPDGGEVEVTYPFLLRGS
jgi:hypothetical protein